MSISSSINANVKELEKDRECHIYIRRRLKRLFRMLKPLGKPVCVSVYVGEARSMTLHWRDSTLNLQADGERIVDIFSRVGEMELITNSDKDDGSRAFTMTKEFRHANFRNRITLALTFHLEPLLDSAAPKGARCRKVVVGTNTHSYSSPKYAIVCD
jgi:hypothetical protein